MSKFKSKSIADLKKKLKRSPDLHQNPATVGEPPVLMSGQSVGSNELIQFEPDTKGCRDCPEGMEW